MKPKIIIFEDQGLLRNLIKTCLEKDFDVLKVDDDAKMMEEYVKLYNPDIILTDICTKNNNNGILYAKKIKEKNSNIKIVAMTGFPEINFLQSAYDASLDGFIYKDIDNNELISTLKMVLNGQRIFPFNNKDNTDASILKTLSNKELEILKLFCSGLDRDDIISKLNISYNTLKNHISNILRKTDYDSISKLVVFCVRNNYII